MTPEPARVVRDMLALADDLVALGHPDSANAQRWLAGAVAKQSGVEMATSDENTAHEHNIGECDESCFDGDGDLIVDRVRGTRLFQEIR